LSEESNKEGEESNKEDESKDELSASERINKLFEQRSEIMNEDRTGFVWLYVRK
jgi:hypothetical protein